MATLTEETRKTLSPFAQSLDRALERIGPELRSLTRIPPAPFRGPAVDVEETATAIFVRAELPGLRRSDFAIEVSPTRVTIRGIKKQESGGEDGEFHTQERRFGSFERVIDVPAPVDPDAAVAAYKDGVLRLMLPKAAGAARILDVSEEDS